MEPPRSLAGSQAESDAAGKTQLPSAQPLTSKKVSDHLANERTFLAWVRTGIAVMAFGFVIERFGLLLREMGLKVGLGANSSLLSSKGLGIVVTILGIVMLVAALLHFVQVRRIIEEEHYLCWLLAASIGEIDILIVSLLLFFDNQYAQWRADLPTRAFLASSAMKQAHQKAHDVLFLPPIWENRQRDVACWRHTICHVQKASAETFSAHLRHALLQLYGKAHAPLR